MVELWVTNLNRRTHSLRSLQNVQLCTVVEIVGTAAIEGDVGGNNRGHSSN